MFNVNFNNRLIDFCKVLYFKTENVVLRKKLTKLLWRKFPTTESEN